MNIRRAWTGQRQGLGLLAALVAGLAAVVVAVAPVGAQANTASMSATLSGGAEVPAIDSPYGGSFSGTINLDTNEISYSL